MINTEHVIRHRLLFAVLAGGLWAGQLLAGPATRTVDRLQTEARGMYLLWAENRADQEELLQLPFVRGGQVTIQWADVERKPGVYDFAEIDRKIAWLAERGKWMTVQVNGNRKPAWLFSQVPHIPQKLHHQVQDAAGTLMFWHPRFEAAHLAMLRALAAHLRANPHRDRLLGIRLNFNAVGTEQLEVPEALRNPDSWVCPAGVEPGRMSAYTPAVREAYLDRVIEAYKREFSGWTVVFVRNQVEGGLLAKLAPDFRAGNLGLFHTGSEAEPRTAAIERRYGLFNDYARSGDTVAYAEPWASAWGEHGGKLDARWCSPCQWNYWTLLLNLHCGVSFVGEYYANLHFAVTAEHAGPPDATANPEEQAKEFKAAYAWADRYVGRHNRPEETPGAWVAFRDNREIKARNNDAPPEAWRLTRFAGDYTFLMERLDGDGSAGVGPVGPPEQRYGAFARSYAAGGVARLNLNEAFRRSLVKGAVVRVIYLDEARTAAAVVAVPSPAGSVPLGELSFHGTGRWVTAEFSLPAAILASAAPDRQIEVSAGAAPLILHLVEVGRL